MAASSTKDFLFEAPPPEGAVKHFTHKGYQIGFSWRDVWQEAHARAFTVAKAMTLDILQDLRAAVDDAITHGMAFEDFRKQLEPILRDKGWWGRRPMTDPITGETREVQLGSFQRLETIYDTNLRTSYAAGVWQQIQDTKDELPYLHYVDPSANPRPQHLAWSEAPTILRVDDPFWDYAFPPNGFNCVPGGTLIATPAGWSQIGGLRRGDSVLGGSGNFHPVIATHRRAFHGDICRITVKGGNALAATPNHRILTLRGWVPAEELQRTDVIIQTTKLAATDCRVRYVNKPNAMAGDRCVTLPRQWETGHLRCFDTEADIGQIYVDPKRANAIIVNRHQPACSKMIEQDLLATGRLHFGVWMLLRMCGKARMCSLCHQGPYFRSAGRGRHAQFFSGTTTTFVIFFGSTKIWMMWHAHDGLAQPDTGPLATFQGIFPLQHDAFGLRPLDNPQVADQSLDGTILNVPLTADFVNTHRGSAIKAAKRGFNGAPLDSFDSLDDFRHWAARATHVRFLHIVNLKRERFDGDVYNLTVARDNSYSTQIGILHNCHCYVDSLSSGDLEHEGWKVSDSAPPGQAEEGFNYNIGEAGIQYAAERALAEKIAEADPDLVAAVKKLH